MPDMDENSGAPWACFAPTTTRDRDAAAGLLWAGLKHGPWHSWGTARTHVGHGVPCPYGFQMVRSASGAASASQVGAKHAVSHPVRAARPGPPGRDGRRAAGLRGTNGASPLRQPRMAMRTRDSCLPWSGRYGSAGPGPTPFPHPWRVQRPCAHAWARLPNPNACASMREWAVTGGPPHEPM